MTFEKPPEVDMSARLSKEWVREGVHCQVYAGYKYLAAVVDGVFIGEWNDAPIEAAVDAIHTEVEYRDTDYPDDLPDRYRCPVCRNRIVHDAESMLDHLIRSHPEKVFDHG